MISQGEQDYRDSIPLTSDSLLVTFGTFFFFPMTVFWSQSEAAPSMFVVVVGCGLERMWMRSRLFAVCELFLPYKVILSR